MFRVSGLVLALVAGLLAVSVAHAQTLTTLVSFNGSNGEYPGGGLTLSADASTLYGTASQGGAYGDGTVFSVPVSGGSPTVLASLNVNASNGGYFPNGDLTLSADGSTLYGTTGYGGAYGNYGTVFSVPVTGGSPTVLASFSGTNGSEAYGGLTLIGNTLYGTTGGGPPYYCGTVFSVPVSGGSPTVLASFVREGPAGGVTLSADGLTLYSMTGYGGAYDHGTVFSIPVTGGSPTVLASFNISDGENSAGGLTLIGNTLYGTTLYGGANGDGTVFALTVPEPSTIALLLASAACLLGYAWRRRRA